MLIACWNDNMLDVWVKYNILLKLTLHVSFYFFSVATGSNPYDYTVEVRNRFKGLDLIECLMNYGQRFVTLYRRQGSRASPWKRNAKKQNECLRRPYK